MANQGINYTSRNFADIRSDLVNQVRQYYPDIFNDFNDASVGMMLLELNAAVGDMLSFNTDRMFQETQIDYAQEQKSVLSMARTFGLKIPNNRPSVTLVDFSVTVPPFGSGFDVSYAPIIRAGSQVTGAGKVFETQNDIDFSDPFMTGGIPNRLIIPNFDSNGNLLNYTLTKREMVINGYSKIFKRVITTSDVVPFLQVILPDTNVTSVEAIIALQGTNYTQDPTLDQFLDPTLLWYEMDALAESKVFIPDTSVSSDNPALDQKIWISTTNKYITEYTDLGFLKITFGGGSQDLSSLSNYTNNSAMLGQIGNFINNMSLGTTPTANTTMFIKYRVGGGSDSNLGANIINSVGTINMVVNGSNPSINNAVQGSLTVNNIFPALGGRNAPSVEEVRNLVKYNFSAQNRAVTIKDYQSRIALMPGQFGVPFRYGVMELQNKIQIYILGLDQNSNLTNTSTTTLMNNISTYLADYRMMNDYISISNGQIINLSFQIDLYVDKRIPQTQIVSQVISDVQSFLDINNYQMGQNIYMSQLVKAINEVGGVYNVIDLRVYNMVGGNYSVNETTMPYLDPITREIDISSDYTLFGDPIGMYEIKYPNVDIMVRVKT